MQYEFQSEKYDIGYISKFDFTDKYPTLTGCTINYETLDSCDFSYLLAVISLPIPKTVIYLSTIGINEISYTIYDLTKTVFSRMMNDIKIEVDYDKITVKCYKDGKLVYSTSYNISDYIFRDIKDIKHYTDKTNKIVSRLYRIF